MRETYINGTPFTVICVLYRTLLRAPACRQKGRPLLGLNELFPAGKATCGRLRQFFPP
jgi:hypothetical protein